MARVVVLTGDLLFGSNLQGALRAGGSEVELAAGAEAARRALATTPAELLVVDLTSEAAERLSEVAALRADGSLGTARILGYFAHVEPEVREQALAAGLDLVVPRSRIAREASELVAGLTGG